MIKSPNSMTVYEAAKYYLKKGFSVIPLHPKSDEPMIEWTQFQNKLPTNEQLKKWFSRQRTKIALVTGNISKIFVVYIDSQYVLDLVESKTDKVTPIVKTSKGWYLYFAYEEDSKIFQNREDFPGIDLRGDGGYVIAPPSIDKSGSQYEWKNQFGLDDRPLQKLPKIFSDYLLASKGKPKLDDQQVENGVGEDDHNTTTTVEPNLYEVKARNRVVKSSGSRFRGKQANWYPDTLLVLAISSEEAGEIARQHIANNRILGIPARKIIGGDVTRDIEIESINRVENLTVDFSKVAKGNINFPVSSHDDLALIETKSASSERRCRIQKRIKEVEDYVDYSDEEKLESIGKEINLRSSAIKFHIFEIGRLLCDAKEMLEHGKYKDWIKESLPFSFETATNIKRVYESCMGVPEMLDYYKASHLYEICSPKFSGELREYLFQNAKNGEFIDVSKKELVMIGLKYKKGEIDLQSTEIQSLIKIRNKKSEIEKCKTEVKEILSYLNKQLKKIKEISSDDHINNPLIAKNRGKDDQVSPKEKFFRLTKDFIAKLEAFEQGDLK